MKMTTELTEFSTLARFDELIKYVELLINDNCADEFFRFVNNQEECRLKWLECQNEKFKLSAALESANRELSSLENKLTIARRLIDQERKQKNVVEEEKKALEKQLQTVREVLSTDNKLHNETKEKLKFLNSTMNRSTDCFGRNSEHLSIIQELESTGSVLSDLSYSRSEDDLDISSMLTCNNRRSRKHRPTLPLEDPIVYKRRRSSKNGEIIKVNTKDADCMVATTTVKLDLDGSISAQSQIETVPSPRSRIVSSESVESGLSVENNALNRKTSTSVGVYPNCMTSSNLNLRQHHLISKTVLRPENCHVCGKRTKFGTTVLRCQDCKSICHVSCKDKLPMPCIQPGNTPTTKGVMGTIADYAPKIPPMVPSLVIHCAQEVEARGLDEKGIYRIPGSDKEIKALKEIFLRNRGVPNLSTISDIHIICGCLKEFLRSLKEPLVTYSLWRHFVSAAEVQDEDMRRAKLIQIIVSDLPQPNRDTLAFVILHLQRVAQCEDATKMCISNLARVFAPTIVGYPQTNIDMYKETRLATEVMLALLNIHPDYWSNIIASSQNIEHTPTSQHIVGNTLSRGFLSTPHEARSLRSKRNFFTPH